MNRFDRKAVVSVGLLWAAMGTLGAKDLTWTADVNTTWDKATANWNDGSGAAVFADSDNVTIRSGTEMTLGGNVSPGDVAFDIAGAFTLKLNGKSLTGLTSFEKLGAGSLTILPSSSSLGMAFHGPVDVKAGTLTLQGANCYGAFSDFSSPAGTEYAIEGGAKMIVTDRNSIGKVDVLGGSAATVRVKKGGTLQFGPITSGSHCANSVSNLFLEGGVLSFTAAGTADIGLLAVLDTVSFSGDAPYVVEKPAVAYAGWLLPPGRPARFDVADISGDGDPDVTFKIPFERYDGMSGRTGEGRGFVKSGAGRLALANAGSTDKQYPNGDITVEEGVLEYTQQASIRGMYDQTYTVKTNATLRFSMRNVVGGTPPEGGNHKTKFVIDHGSFVIDDPAGSPGHIYLGEELVLDHATFTTTMSGFGNGVTALGALTFGRLVSFKGDTPYDFSPFQGMGNPFLHLGADPLTEIRVADITDSASADVTLGYTLCDRYYDTIPALKPGGFVKTGAGTLQIPVCSAYRGNVEVREGTLLLDAPDYASAKFGANAKSYIGDMTVDGRTVTVSTNGVLFFAQRNMLGGYSYGDTGANGIRTEFVFRGGTLRVGPNAATPLGSVTFDGGAVSYADASGWGPFNFRGTFRVTGDKPLTLPATTSGNSIMALYPLHACVFDVEDVTGDGRVDLDSHLALTKPADPSYYDGTKTNQQTKTAYVYTYGFTKTGVGTMALNTSAGNLDFDDEARVTAGTMLVNCNLSKAGPFTVAAGAALGGTGSVRAATLAEGAGFAATAGQANSLTVAGDLAIPATGTVRLTLPEGTDPEKAKAGVVKATGTVTGLANLAQWTVTVEGHPELSKEFRISVVGNEVRVGPNKGLMLLFR